MKKMLYIFFLVITFALGALSQSYLGGKFQSKNKNYNESNLFDDENITSELFGKSGLTNPKISELQKNAKVYRISYTDTHDYIILEWEESGKKTYEAYEYINSLNHLK